MVCGILVSGTVITYKLFLLTHPPQTWKFGYDFAMVTAGTMAAYAWFTVRTTSWR